MNEKIELPLDKLDEINLSLDRAGSVTDLVLSYAAVNTPNKKHFSVRHNRTH